MGPNVNAGLMPLAGRKISLMRPVLGIVQLFDFYSTAL